MLRVDGLHAVVRFTRLATVAFAASVLLLPGTASAGDLTGHLFIRTAIGDAKRIADLQVALVPATREFEAAWKDLVAAFEGERSAALQALRKAESEKAAAQAEYLRLVGAGGPAFADASAREGAALQELERAKKVVAALPGQYPKKAKDLLR